MTYKEFEKWCEDNGYVCTSDNKRMRVYCGGFTVLSITINAMYGLSSDWTDSTPKELFEKAVELARTPLEEREEPRKYYVKIRQGEHGALALLESSGGIHHFAGSAKTDIDEMYQLTEEQIKAIDPRFMPFAVEVEE